MHRQIVFSQFQFSLYNQHRKTADTRRYRARLDYFRHGNFTRSSGFAVFKRVMGWLTHPPHLTTDQSFMVSIKLHC